MPVRLIYRCLIRAALALLLMTILVASSLVLAKNVYATDHCDGLSLCLTVLDPFQSHSPGLEAMDYCDLLPICPSPTPNLAPSPTPASNPTPSPTPASNRTPSPTLTPPPYSTGTASVSPTATSVGGTPTPVSSPTSIPVTKRGNTGNQTPNLWRESGFSQMMGIVTFIFLFLILGLAIGLFLFRGRLLPSIDMKMPSRNARSWSLTGVPQTFAGETSKTKKRW